MQLIIPPFTEQGKTKFPWATCIVLLYFLYMTSQRVVVVKPFYLLNFQDFKAILGSSKRYYRQ